jgi:hypothetical protein
MRRALTSYGRFNRTRLRVSSTTTKTLGVQYSACLGFPMLDEGVWAEVKVGGEHLRLFSEHNALGVQASVYNVKAKTWIAPSEPVEDIEQGKQRAAEYAMAYLKASNAELPTLNWKKSRSR